MKTFKISVSATLLCSLIIFSWAKVSFSAVGSDFTAVPPFISKEAPPLVMLVMGRNHKLYYEAYNDASDLNEDDILDVGYNPAIDYYGYFDSFKCYTYSSTDSNIHPGHATSATTTDLFTPSTLAPDKTCSNNDEWSGDFLNYINMTRMDTMRKVLFGGYRSTDTNSSTILERVYVPQDAHTWGKEYTSTSYDGYDIADYAPLSQPVSGTRHLFASTTLSAGGNPIMRIYPNNHHRIWEWVAREGRAARDNVIGEVAGGYPGHPSDHLSFQDMVETYAIGANQFVPIAPLTGDWQTDGNGRIDGEGNPYGNDYVPYVSGAADQEHYMALFTGEITIATAGDYTFNVNGDDAVEVIINGGTANEAIAGWYGGHGRDGCRDGDNDGNIDDTGACDNTVTTTLPAGSHTIEFRMEEYGGGDNYHLAWNGPDSGNIWQIVPSATFSSLFLDTFKLISATGSAIEDYSLRVEVCKTTPGLESNCKEYTDSSGNSSYKPIGILQRHGEPQKMYFGLMTGSWTNNARGGVLRRNISDINDEINSDDGTFDTAINGIINTINSLRIYGYHYDAAPGTNGSYNMNCGWVTSGPISNGQCRDWGNPIAEMMYETERYFAGKGTPTSDYLYTETGTTDDEALGLDLATWIDPYDTSGGGFAYCSKPFMLVLSDINPTYDVDNLPGVDPIFGVGLTGDIAGLDVSTLATTISDTEGINGNKFIGQSGTVSDGACTVKDVTGFANISGLCPEEPTKLGGYYSAAIAYHAQITDVNPADGDQKITTYSVGLASPLPRIDLDVGGNPITLVPFAKTVGSRNSANVWNYWPTNTIVDFFVETLTPTSGIFRINYEDVEQGADHDMDDIVVYEYQLIDGTGANVSDPADATAVNITLTTTYAAGSYIEHAGYVISGTTADGTYLEVTDLDTNPVNDFLVALDTPPGVGPLDPTDAGDAAIIASRDQPGSTHDSSLGTLPYTATRSFTPDPAGGATVAQLIESPLWYAAKWGAFEDKDGDNIVDNDEWDEDNNGVPDTYYYVTNPLRLEEQLNRSFADILRRASSGTAASVISNSRSGEGAIYQSFFYPELTDADGYSVSWVGQIHSLLVDAFGNMRDDANNNQRLDITLRDINNEEIITYHEDANFNGSLDTEDANGNGLLDTGEDLNNNDQLDTEDRNDNSLLDVAANVTTFRAGIDPIIRFAPGGIIRYYDINGNQQLDGFESAFPYSTNQAIDSLHHIWNSTDWLNTISDAAITPQRSISGNDYITATTNRYIFSWVDADTDKEVDASEIVDFAWPSTAPTWDELDDLDKLYPYLHLYPSFSNTPAAITTLQGNDALFKEFLVKQSERVINYTRGLDQPILSLEGSDIAGTDMRSRQYGSHDVSGTDTPSYWRLGDIVNSTPTLVGRPAEAFHLLYDDYSYANFYKRWENRRQVIYAGANDGMLHAFNAGFYAPGHYQFCREIDSSYNPYDDILTNNEPCLSSTSMATIGQELWAYVPFNLLPHLYWLTEPDYSHIYYMDLKPRIFDAQIFTEEAACAADPLAEACKHPDGWGTVMAVGMRFGGASIVADLNKLDGTTEDADGTAPDDPTMKSAIILMDITDPENPPELLAEISFPDMGFTTCYPTVLALKDPDQNDTRDPYNDTDPSIGENRWFLAIGSGPADANGDPHADVLSTAVSSQPANFYFLDLVKLGTKKEIWTLEKDSIQDGGNLTAGLHTYATFDTDAFVSDPISVDIELSYNADAVYFGTVSGADPNFDGNIRRIVIDDINDGDASDDQDPVNWDAPSILIDTNAPVTAAPAIGIDVDKRLWIFNGTGRFFVNSDKEYLANQSFFGLKEPIDAITKERTWGMLDRVTDLVDTTNYRVFSDANRTVDADGTITSWFDIAAAQTLKDGWVLDFDTTDTTGERNLGQATLFGGLVGFTTYEPDSDICAASGVSYLWALYYQTGTAFYTGILGTSTQSVGVSTEEMAEPKISLGDGLASSPNIHIGRETGSSSFVQSSTGEIKTIEQKNPGATKSGVISWEVYKK